MHDLLDQGSASDTGSQPIAKPEADSTRVALAYSIGFAGHDPRHAFSDLITECHPARRDDRR